MGVNLNVGSLVDAGFQNVSHTQESGRHVYRLHMPEGLEQAVYIAARQALDALVEANGLTLLVPLGGEQEPHEDVQLYRELVINGDIACLTDRPKAHSQLSVDAKDSFFTQAQLQVPVECSKGTHRFERHYIEAWIAQKGDVCPHRLRQHEVGEIVNDPDLTARVEHLVHQHEQNLQNAADLAQAQEAANEAAINAQNAGERAIQMHIANNAQLSTELTRRGIEGVSDGAKIIAKGSSLYLAKAACEGEKCVAHGLAKNVPGVSLIVGLCMGYYRYQEGVQRGDSAQKWKALGEVASGMVACYPGGGMVASVLIDACMGAHDIAEVRGEKIYINGDLDNAYRMFGLDRNGNHTRQEVNQAYQQASLLVHPDRLPPEIRQGAYANNLQAILNQHRASIYADKGWQL